MTVKNAVVTYLKLIKLHRTSGTYQFYKQYLAYIVDYFSDQDIMSIDEDSMISYLTHIQDKNSEISKATLNKHLTVFKSFYRHTTKNEFKYPKFKENKKIIPTISDEIINKVFSYYRPKLHINYQFRNYLFLRLLLDTGLRMNELINVSIDDICFEDNSILAKVTKSDVDRYVFFSNETARHLTRFIIDHSCTDNLFFDFETGNKMTVTSVETMISRLRHRLNINQSISPHKWRHTFATRFSRKGGNIEILRMLLGHSNLKTTQKYLHLNREDLHRDYIRIFNN